MAELSNNLSQTTNKVKSFLSRMLSATDWQKLWNKPDLEVITLREASELLSMSVKALRMHILRGHLPAYKLGGKIYLKLEEIEKALKPIGARAGKGASQNNKGGTK